MTIYTCIIGDYDFLKPVLYPQDKDIKFVLFTDQDMDSPIFDLCNKEDLKQWEVIKIKVMDCGASRTARYYKINFHKVIDDDLSFWLDGSFFIDTDLKNWVARMGNDDFVTVAHPFDDCLYVDAASCLRMDKGDKNQILGQIQEYEDLGIPKNNGLIAAGMLMRRRTPAVIEACEAWWEQLEKHSVRDQVAFGYVNWKYPGVHRSIKWNYTVQTEFKFCAHRHKPWGTQKAIEINNNRHESN
jgi:hypothetical protein